MQWSMLRMTTIGFGLTLYSVKLSMNMHLGISLVRHSPSFPTAKKVSSSPSNGCFLVVLIVTAFDICMITFTSNSNILPFEPAFIELQQQSRKRITTLHLTRCVVSIQTLSIGCWSMPHGSIGLNATSQVIAMVITHTILLSLLMHGSWMLVRNRFSRS